MNNERLRHLLDEKINNELRLERHASALAEIASEVPHTIVIRPSPLDEPLTEFNCVMHALGLVGRIEDPYGRPWGGWWADTAFLRALISDGVLSARSPVPGAIVTWSSQGVLKHVGRLGGLDRATSKWGVGHVYEHGLLEIPTTYGSQLAFYSPLAADTAMAELCRYYGN